MADQTERLLLQVDAATEMLRRHLAEGEQPLERFERRTAKMAENVDRSIGDMGKRFGAFAGLAESAADRAQKSFEASFSQVQRLAATAIKAPTIDGRVNLGADDIRAGAAAAQDQARAFALIGEAAERAALAERDTSEATRLFIQATSASRIEAEQKAAALLAEAGALERVEIELRQSAEATELFVTKHQRIAEAAAEQQRLAIATENTAREQRVLGASADALRASIDPMYAAQQRFDTELTRAETLLSAGTITTREYEAAVRVATAALQAHAATVTGVVERERLLAASAETAAQGQRALAAAADIVRAELDPMFLAQKRFDDEMNRADALLEAGVLHQREYAAAVAQARANLYAHAQSVAGAGSRTNALTTNTNALRYAMQGASYQVQDTFTQISMGANVLQVVAIQGGQLAGQFANIEGKAGSVARFMIGPWGLAITGALLVLGPLTKGLLNFGDATDKAVDKLRQDAVEADTASRAKAAFGASVDGVTAALRDQDEALRKSAAAEHTAAEQANINAKNKREQALAARQHTVALLEEAKAQIALSGSANVGSAAAGMMARTGAEQRVIALDAELAKANAAVTKAEQQVNVTRVDLAAEQAATALDPVKSVTKAYDDQIKAVKDAQREEARLGAQVGTASKLRIQALEAEKKAAVDAAQARVAAARRAASGAGNNQIGRQISVAEARQIVAGFGGVVTSGQRSRADQERIYADKLAGRHSGPVAKPGTSDHERGQAVDIAYGAGITIAKIKAEFAKQGVALRQVLDEPGQRVFHVAFGKKGPAQETVDRRVENARVKAIADKLAYDQEEHAAQRRLIDATRGAAVTEEQRDQLAIDDINAQANAQRDKIKAQVGEKKIDAAQAAHLTTINEATRTQEIANVKADAALRKLGRRYDAEQDDLQAQLALLRISEDMATTDAQRRDLSGQILTIEQEIRRKALEKLRDTSQNPADVQAAKDQLARLPKLDQAEREQSDRRNASPLDQYRQRLHAATDDMQAALSGVAANGLQSVEDGLLGIVDGTESVGSAFKKMAASIISDLARIAIEKAIVKAVGSSFFGLAGGGAIGDLPGFADGGTPGGKISGPGTGRSDNILAILGGGKGAIRVSNGEYIINEQATREYLPIIEAINARRLPRFASGGPLGTTPSLNLREPRLRDLSGSRNSRLAVDVNTRVEASPLLLATVQDTSIRTVGAAAEPIMAGATARTISKLRRPMLPGGMG